MSSLRSSLRDDGTSNMMRMGDPSRDQNKNTVTVGILGQMKKNTDAKQRRTENHTPYTSRRKQNSFKSFRPNSNDKSWLICAIGSFFIIGMLAGGAVVGIKYSAIGGWSVFAFGIVLLIAIIVYLCVTKRKQTARSATAEATKPPTFYHTDINDFPFDPVLQRGITSLIYHGQHDCHTCSLMRENENVRRLCPSVHEGEEEAFMNVDRRNVSLNSLATTYDQPTEENSSTSHHVVVHDEQGHIRWYSEIKDTKHPPDQQETSFIAPHSGQINIADIEHDVARDVTHTNNKIKSNNDSRHTYEIDNAAFTDPSVSAPDDDVSRHVSAAVLSRDSILTTKKRRKSRNKSWKAKGQDRDDTTSTEEASLSSESQEELSETVDKSPKETKHVTLKEARRTLSHDSFLTTKKRKMQRIEEWTKRKSRQSELRSHDVKEET